MEPVLPRRADMPAVAPAGWRPGSNEAARPGQTPGTQQSFYNNEIPDRYILTWCRPPTADG